MLITNNISYSIGNSVILKNINFSLKPGEFTAIVGSNGAGKSSLLKIITGENKYYKGEVIYHGKLLGAFRINEIAKVRSVLPQESQVSYPFTVKEIVEMGRSTFTEKKSQLDAIVEEVMQSTGVASFKDRNYHTLSGGEKQKVQLTRVIAQIWGNGNFPKFIFLDEPTASLDMAQQHQILGLTKKLCKKNIGIMAVIHDLNLAAQYADYMVFMKKGKIINQGTVKEVMTKENVEKTFEHEVTLAFNGVSDVPVVLPKSHQEVSKNNFSRNLKFESYEQINNRGI